MKYYAGNGVYDFLIKNGYQDSFFWTSGNLWLLVYGDEDNEPKVLTVASENALNVKVTDEERMAVHVAQQIAAGIGVPVNYVRFDPNKPIERVRYWETGMRKIPVISSSDLRGRFSRFGLRMNEKAAGKRINDRSSSPYHEWQRAHMGASVVVSDIDLLRLEEGIPVEIIELKRSYIALEKWKPYPEDHNNFELISKLARKRGLGFYIVYNRRTKTPFFDDVSRLKIYTFDHRQRPCSRLLGYKTILRFAKNGTDEGGR